MGRNNVIDPLYSGDRALGNVENQGVGASIYSAGANGDYDEDVINV